MTEDNNEKKGTITQPDDNEFYRFFNQKVSANEEFVIQFYRVDRKGNKTYKKWLEDFCDTLPNRQEIAEEYGGGHFWMVAWDDKGNKLEKNLWIDEIWTRRLIESKRVEPGPPKSIEDYKAPDPIEMMKNMFGMMKPILEASAKSNNQPAQMVDMMPKLMEGMTEAMMKSLGRVQTAVINKQLESLNAPSQEPKVKEETIGEKMQYVKEIIEIAKEFGDKLLTANGAKGKMMEKFIKSDKRFSEIAEDPQLYDALYTAAVEDPDIGKSKADALFKKLGFEIGETAGANN